MADGCQPRPERQTLFDDYLTSWARRCAEKQDLGGVRLLANVICDVGLGLLAWHAEPWEPLLSPARRQFLLHEAILILQHAQRTTEAFELSQRMKAFAFSLPTLQRLATSPAAPQAARPALSRLRDLHNTVAVLLTATPDTVSERVVALSRAGAAFASSLEAVRDQDRALYARMGGVLRPDDLIDAFPADDPVAVVDLVVASKGSVGQILVRRGDKIERQPAVFPAFTALDAMRLDESWSRQRMTHAVPSDTQRRALAAICDELHDRFGCALAAKLADLIAVQVVLVPDELTRRLPLHLVRLCSKEIQVAGVDTSGAEYFCEKFPVEYVPAVQAIAVSQHQKRPSKISRVVSIADPRGDLPAARDTSAFLASRLAQGPAFSEYLGQTATLDALRDALRSATVVMIGTHGVFDPADPARSYLELADGRWTLAEMIDGEAFIQSPVLLLCACEVAAATEGDEAAAGGIPAALLSRGAAGVLGALWPIEDFSAGFLVERFLHHLAHPGLRPAAALFRAVRSLRRLSRADALMRAQRRLAELVAESQRPGAPTGIAESMLLMDDLCARLSKRGDEHPFAGPEFWGAIVVAGSGWHSPQGGVIGGAATIMRIAEALLAREEVGERVARGDFSAARAKLERALPHLDGLERARTLDTLAWVVWSGRSDDRDQAAFRESLDLLRRARATAQSEDAPDLLRNIMATEQKIRLQHED